MIHFSMILLALSMACTSFAATLTGLNSELLLAMKRDGVAAPFSHKLPSFYIEDNTVNMVTLSDSVDEDLRAAPTLSPVSIIPIEVLDVRNEAALKMLDKWQPTYQDDSLSEKEARRLVDQARNHPVVGIAALEKYDPIDPVTHQRRNGFCFGRADYLYFELLRMGIPRSSIIKLFQIGAISGDPTFGRPWSNHIVTLVRSDRGGWWALDPFYNLVVTPREWVSRNRSVAKNNKTLIYLGNVERVNAQGGIQSRPALTDASFPVSRIMVTVNGQPFESIKFPKDHFYFNYYFDMYQSLINSNRPGHEFDFCKNLGWCNPVGPIPPDPQSDAGSAFRGFQ